MTFYLPKPDPWVLDPALTERPDWWRRASVLPYWEGQGLPRFYDKTSIDGRALLATAGVLGTDYAWVKTPTGRALSFLTTVPRLNWAADSEIFNPSFLNRCTILVARTPNDTTNRASLLFSTRYGATLTKLCHGYGPYSDGAVYFDFGGNSTGTTEISFSGYTKDTSRMDLFAFRAGTAFGHAIFWNGTKKATSATVTTRVAAELDGFYASGNGNLDAGISDVVRYHFMAAFDEEWPDAQIYEWMRDPFAMLRPRGLGLIVAATQGGISAAVGSASGTSSMAAIAPEQVARPDGDYSVGDWTTESGGTSNLYQSIDESTASDTDYIRSAEGPADSITTISLSDVTDLPGVGGGRVTVRYYKEGTETINLTVYLMEGATEIASWTLSSISESVVQFDNIISIAQVASIVDRTNLQVKLKKSLS